jgi:hypothetical protein
MELNPIKLSFNKGIAGLNKLIEEKNKNSRNVVKKI